MGSAIPAPAIAEPGGSPRPFRLRASQRFMRLIRRLLRRREGAVAVEYALILPVYVYLLAGIIEMSMLFYTTTVVDGAVMDAGRQILTGQAQQSASTLTTFQTSLCSALGSVYNCNNMTFNVQTFSSFATVSMPDVYLDADGNLVDVDGNPIALPFNAGASGEITVVRVIYSWTFFTPLIGNLMTGSSSKTKLLSTTTVFRNEPY
jgi:Flp pilus assembly protein TadG